jgi:hypothetical protein
MADPQRFTLFARFVVEHFPTGRVFDVAGGLGKLNQALTALGREVETFDRRHKHLGVAYAQRAFTLDEPCDAGLVVGMHPDGATRVIIEYAALHHLPFAVVPCCSDNGMSYKPWMRHLEAFARARGFHELGQEALPMRGRARVLYGRFLPRASGPPPSIIDQI